MLAAAWFTLRGFTVSWPLEPRRYDLLVERGAVVQRVQVKSTTARDGKSYAATVCNSRSGGSAAYSPDEVDCFFIVDGDLDAYVIPLAVVAGFQRLNLTNYTAYRVANAGQLLAG